jgi:hypothetical protein
MKETIDAVFTPRGLMPSAIGNGDRVQQVSSSSSAVGSTTSQHATTVWSSSSSSGASPVPSLSVAVGLPARGFDFAQLKASIENPSIVLRKVSAELVTPRGKRQAAAMDSSLLGVIARALVDRRRFLEKTPRDQPPPTARWNAPDAWDV